MSSYQRNVVITHNNIPNSKKSCQALEAVNILVDAINRGDLQSALNTYEANANLLIGAGKMAHGKHAIRAALEEFISKKYAIESLSAELIEDTEMAVCCLRWILKKSFGENNFEQETGVSVKVFRRQADGNWLISIDSPWGIDILADVF